MRTAGRRLLADLVVALHCPGATHAEEPVYQGWVEFVSEASAYLARQQDATPDEDGALLLIFTDVHRVE